MLNISCNLLNTVLNVKNRMVVCWLFTLMIARLTVNWGLTASVQHHERVIVWHIASPGKDQNSKYGFYWMCIPFAPLWSWRIVSQTIISWGLFLEIHTNLKLSWLNIVQFIYIISCWIVHSFSLLYTILQFVFKFFSKWICRWLLVFVCLVCFILFFAVKNNSATNILIHMPCYNIGKFAKDVYPGVE